ncbi:MAG: 16S rRNA (guanine(966)-N(2))-methyltransferase RsmD [Polaromonas sp.]|uniref:16S rRNA (guanine(966)-N(2))-methyltransferase RsmD n=1 Tax=Polaromonas sp. TaxID=1869339 RepID=UPI002734BCF2|nr:16S rRNA (guanine(966)-N(2))-methyltransferase RsmD [Polaromonas sp.]MDP3798532.1 16S rRNA (guanine(966)-N(2))-methyltransferase RsmD [Polaromonas sp.]
MKYTPASTGASTKPKTGPRPKGGKVVGRKTVPPGEIRIIGGLYKRTRLPVPSKPGLRPTPDRVRETLFNWLGQDLTGWRCVDVFAGTGALGFEAASRGAAEVLLCEQDPALVLQLKALQTQLQAGMVRVERGDGVGLLRRLPAASMQLVLLDPPFESELFEPALKAAVQVIGETGLIYLEAPRAWLDDELQLLGLRIWRSGKAGAVHFHLLARSGT